MLLAQQSLRQPSAPLHGMLFVPFPVQKAQLWIKSSLTEEM